MNQLHMLSFATDASNDIFTFKQAMKEPDKLQFVAAMRKETLIMKIVTTGPSLNARPSLTPPNQYKLFGRSNVNDCRTARC